MDARSRVIQPAWRVLHAALERGKLDEDGMRILCEEIAQSPTQRSFFGVISENAARVVERRWQDLVRFASDLVAEKLTLTDQQIEIPFDLEQLWECYLPLARWLFCQWNCPSRRACTTKLGRFVVGVAGIGASGKTMFCEILSRILGRMLEELGLSVKTIPMDGYHFPNAYLNSHLGRAPDGELLPLRMLKGMPQTFDVVRFHKDLARLRAERTLRFPAYSRVLHDPVEGAIEITERDQLILVEGNYILLREGEWAKCKPLFDLSFFIDVPRDAARAAMIPRLARGHYTLDEAAARYDRFDAHNAELVLASMGRADIVIQRDHAFRVIGVKWNREPGG